MPPAGDRAERSGRRGVERRSRRNPHRRHGGTEDARSESFKMTSGQPDKSGLWRRAPRGTNRPSRANTSGSVSNRPLVFARLDLFVQPAEGGRATGHLRVPPCLRASCRFSPCSPCSPFAPRLAHSDSSAFLRLSAPAGLPRVHRFVLPNRQKMNCVWIRSSLSCRLLLFVAPRPVSRRPKSICSLSAWRR